MNRPLVSSSNNSPSAAPPPVGVTAEDFDSIAAYYDYGYDEEKIAESLLAPQTANACIAAGGLDSAATDETNKTISLAKASDMALRMSRKKHSLARRRNGAGHAILLKSAVLASLDAELDSSDDNELHFSDDGDGDEGECDSQTHLECSIESELQASPVRKRARRFSQCSSSDAEDDAAIALASSLFGDVVNISPQTPVKRLSRRRSHNNSPSLQSDASERAGKE